MCTALSVKTSHGDIFLGRNMDFSFPLAPQLYAVPKGYEWNNMCDTIQIKARYGFMGMGQDISPINFADGVNEMGFAAAALYFQGYAQYDEISLYDSKLPPIAAVELVKLLLSLCACVEQAVHVLHKISIVGIKDSVTGSIAPLHWIIADKNGKCMVVEKTVNGLKIIDNPVGVLSNSPDFQWHMTNLRNYMNLEPFQKEAAEWGSVPLTPFGQGAGTLGMPGDYTPPSRFVRTAYHKNYAYFSADRDEAVVACFHILESVTIPKGAVMTARGTSDYTQYTVFIDLASGEYFYRTYDNSQIIRVKPSFRQEYDMEIRLMGKLVGPVVFGNLQENR